MAASRESAGKLQAGLGINIYRFITGEESGGLAILILILLVTTVAVGASVFFDSYNLFSTFRQFSFIGMAALGELLVLLIGGIDLSIGAVACLSGIVTAWFMANTGMDPWLTLAIGALVGILAGFINGILITKVKINPFIVTLGAMQVYFSVSMIVTKGWPITKINQDIVWIGQGNLGDLFPYATIFLLILVLALEIVLRYSTLGRRLYCLGNSEKASFLCGVNVDRTKILAYTLSGFLASMAGIISMARLNSGQPTAGVGWEMQAIAAVIIGGGSMAGGSGSAFGTLIGAAVLGIVAQDIVLLSVSPFWQRVVLGLVVIAAVIFDQVRKRLRK
ncbi:MAG: ABC transporter permease [Bacillota bacterium]